MMLNEKFDIEEFEVTFTFTGGQRVQQDTHFDPENFKCLAKIENVLCHTILMRS